MKLLETFEKDFIGRTAFQGLEETAARRGHLEMLKYLHTNKLKDLHSKNIHMFDCYSDGVLRAALTGGHINILEECFSNHHKKSDIGLYDAYSIAASYGHLHIIEWLEENKHQHDFVFLKARRPFQDFHEDLFDTAVIPQAISHGHTHILDWAREKGWIRVSAVCMLSIATQRFGVQIIARYKSIDWILDRFSVGLDENWRTLIPDLFIERQFDLAEHLFMRGIVLDTELLLETIASAERRGQDPRVTKKHVTKMLKVVKNAENEPDKYIVETMDGSRCVLLRYPSSEHYRGQ